MNSLLLNCDISESFGAWTMGLDAEVMPLRQHRLRLPCLHPRYHAQDRGPGDGLFQALCDEYNLTLWFEAFANRAYDSEGFLVSRMRPGAVHHDSEIIVNQAVPLARDKLLVASDGSTMLLRAQTLCVHGDNASSVATVKRICQAFDTLVQA